MEVGINTSCACRERTTVTTVERVLDVHHRVDDESGEQVPCTNDHCGKFKWEVRGQETTRDQDGLVDFVHFGVKWGGSGQPRCARLNSCGQAVDQTIYHSDSGTNTKKKKTGVRRSTVSYIKRVCCDQSCSSEFSGMKEQSTTPGNSTNASKAFTCVGYSCGSKQGVPLPCRSANLRTA